MTTLIIILTAFKGRFSHSQEVYFITDSTFYLTRRLGKDLQVTFSCIENLLQCAFYLVLWKLENKWTKSLPTTCLSKFIPTEVFSKENGSFPYRENHTLQRIHSWKSSTNSSW